jgi:hypothetical protein
VSVMIVVIVVSIIVDCTGSHCQPNTSFVFQLHRNEYFQDILNRIVITVMFGMTSPLQGAQIVHGCAAILGLDLLKQLPVTTLVITGMRKTNDLAQGHNFIVKAFKTFGTIEEAAIAPNNRGFGKSNIRKLDGSFYMKYRSLTISPYLQQALFVSRNQNPCNEHSKSIENSK